MTLGDMLTDKSIAVDAAQGRALAALQSLFDELTTPAALKSPLPFMRGGRQGGGFLSAFRSSGPRKPYPKGVYLYGGVGRGKSMLMDLFYEALPPSVAKARVHFHEFMIRVHDDLHRARQSGKTGNGPDRALLDFADRIAAETRVLCFDEFHVTDIADAMILGRLFTALFDKGLAVVATSNWPPARLYEGGLQRDRFLPFITLVQERMNVVEVDDGTDYRLRALSADGVYFWPLGEHTRQRMDSVFSHLTDGAPVRAEELHVKGRVIPVPAAAKGVARFSFAQLCEQALGAEDYLKVATIYHTVFLENIPKLTYDRRNEAKRLMILIDALYDNGIKLIVSADAPPDQLYRGSDHAFEFQRTVSRLTEMQSPDYLSKKT